MSTAAEFAKFLFTRSPEKKSAAELSLYNAFRKNHQEGQRLDRALLRQIFSDLLCFPHWRDKFDELHKCFRRYWQLFGDQGLVNIEFDPSEIEILSLQKNKNAIGFFENYFASKYPDAQIRCCSLRRMEYLVLVLKSDASLQVQHLNHDLALLDGQLEPLWQDLCLYYDANLQLDKKHSHRLLVAPFRFLQLQWDASHWRIEESQGYSLKALRPKTVDRLEEHSELFYQIRAIESKFIQKSSDPLYLQLTRSIEESIEKLAENPELYKDRALEIYHKGRNAYENIFTDDRLLHLLLKELAMTLAAGRAKTWDEPEPEGGEEWLKLNPLQNFDSTNS